MPDPTRDTLFQQAAKKIRADFEEISSQVPHSGEAGQEAEGVVKTFLSSYLPKRFDCSSGFIIDSLDKVSSQQDIIIYDAYHCPVYRPGDRTMIIPNDNVAATIEVKSNLTTANLRESLSKIHKVKKLAKTHFSPKEDIGPDLSHTFSVIFAFSSEVKLASVLQIWDEQIKTDQTDIFHSCNLIVVLDHSVFTTVVQIPGEEGVAPCNFGGIANTAPVGMKIGLGHMSTNQGTLDVMMRLLIAHFTFFWDRVSHPGFNFSRFGRYDVRWILQKRS